MPTTNNNMSKENIKDVYRHLICKAENLGEPSSVLRNRLNVLIKRENDTENKKLTTAKDYLKSVIKEIEDNQDKYGISIPLYYEIKDFISV